MLQIKVAGEFWCAHLLREFLNCQNFVQILHSYKKGLEAYTNSYSSINCQRFVLCFSNSGCYPSRWIHNFIFTVVKALLLRLDVTTGCCGWDLNISPLLRRKYDYEITFGQNFVCQSLFCQWHVPLTVCFYRQSRMPILYRSNLQRVRSSRRNLPGKIQTIVRSLTLTANLYTVSGIASFLR